MNKKNIIFLSLSFLTIGSAAHSMEHWEYDQGERKSKLIRMLEARGDKTKTVSSLKKLSANIFYENPDRLIPHFHKLDEDSGLYAIDQLNDEWFDERASELFKKIFDERINCKVHCAIIKRLPQECIKNNKHILTDEVIKGHNHLVCCTLVERLDRIELANIVAERNTITVGVANIFVKKFDNQYIQSGKLLAKFFTTNSYSLKTLCKKIAPPGVLLHDNLGIFTKVLFNYFFYKMKPDMESKIYGYKPSEKFTEKDFDSLCKKQPYGSIKIVNNIGLIKDCDGNTISCIENLKKYKSCIFFIYNPGTRSTELKINCNVTISPNKNLIVIGEYIFCIENNIVLILPLLPTKIAFSDNSQHLYVNSIWNKNILKFDLLLFDEINNDIGLEQLICLIALNSLDKIKKELSVQYLNSIKNLHNNSDIFPSAMRNEFLKNLFENMCNLADSDPQEFFKQIPKCIDSIMIEKIEEDFRQQLPSVALDKRLGMVSIILQITNMIENANYPPDHNQLHCFVKSILAATIYHYIFGHSLENKAKKTKNKMLIEIADLIKNAKQDFLQRLH